MGPGLQHTARVLASEDFGDALEAAAGEVDLGSCARAELRSQLAGVRLRRADDLAEVAVYVDRLRGSDAAAMGAA